MNSSLLLATCTASEELPRWMSQVAIIALLGAALFAVAALFLAYFSPCRVTLAKVCSLLALTVGAYPFCFAWYVHYIDFVPIAMDGTPASPPLIQTLAIPALPIFIGLAAILLRSKRPCKTLPTR